MEKTIEVAPKKEKRQEEERKGDSKGRRKGME